MDIQPQRPVRKVFWSSAQKLCEGVERTGFPGVADLASETFHVLRTVRSNKKSRDRLAVRVSQIIRVLKDAEEPTGTETSSYPLLDSLDQLRRALEATAHTIADISRMSCISQCLQYSSVHNTLDEHSHRLEQALNLFNTQRVEQLKVAVTELKSSVVGVVRKDKLRRVRPHERHLLGGYKDTRWELVRVAGVKYLAKRYSPVNHAKFESDVAVYTRLGYFGLPQISGVFEEPSEDSMLFFQYPEVFVKPGGSQLSPQGLIDTLVDGKDFWRLRTVATRLYYDVIDTLDHLRDRGVRTVNGFSFSQLSISENGRFIFTDGDLQISATAEGAPQPESRPRNLVVDLFGSVMNPEDLFMQKLEMILCRLEGRSRDAFRSLPTDLSQIMEDPTFALCNDGRLSFFTDNFSRTEMSSKYLPGDVLYVPDRHLRAGAPHKLCNVAARFGWNYDTPYSTKHSFTGKWSPEILEPDPSSWQIPLDMTAELLEPDRNFSSIRSDLPIGPMEPVRFSLEIPAPVAPEFSDTAQILERDPSPWPIPLDMTPELERLETGDEVWSIQSNFVTEPTEPVQFPLGAPGHVAPEPRDPAQIFWKALFDKNINNGGPTPDTGSFIGYLVRGVKSGEYGIKYQQSMLHNDPKLYSEYRNILPQLAHEFKLNEDQLVLVSKVTSHIGISIGCNAEQPLHDLHLYISRDATCMPHWTISASAPEEPVRLGDVGAIETWQGPGHTIVSEIKSCQVEILHFEQDELTVMSL